MTRHAGPSGKQKRQHASGDRLLVPLEQAVAALNYPEVERLARGILARQNRHPFALKALAVAFMGQGRYKEAMDMLVPTVRLYPQDPELHNNLGICRSVLLEWPGAIDSFGAALALDGNNWLTHKNLGVAYLRMHRWDMAAPCFLRAIELDQGEDRDTILNLALALEYSGSMAEALEIYGELAADDPRNLAYLTQMIGTSLKLSNWEIFARTLTPWHRLASQKLDAWGGNPFSLFSLPGVTAREHRRFAEAHAEAMVVFPARQAVAADAAPAAQAAEAGRRLRIAYLSADFRNHPVGYVLPEVIERHDRQQFEIVAYSMKPDDGSEIRQRLMAAFDRFVAIDDLSDPEAARRIREDGIDILVDLQGWTAYDRAQLLALRPAPLQLEWLGFAGTLGDSRLADYLIGDPVVTPQSEAEYYAESIAQLPGCYLPADTTRPVGSPPSRDEAGLPAEGFVFCSFNANYKFNPDVFDLWCSILAACPGSVLWLSRPGELAQANLLREAEQRGIAGSRIIFAPRIDDYAQHLSRLSLADLALDPFPYNSHSTGIDTLWAGVPLLTLLGDTFPGRVGASLLKAAGLDELVTRSAADYASLAIDLYRDSGRLNSLRGRVSAARRRSSLFDMQGFTRDLEDLYLRLWENARGGEKLPFVGPTR